jgi:hypothetical protein
MIVVEKLFQYFFLQSRFVHNSALMAQNHAQRKACTAVTASTVSWQPSATTSMTILATTSAACLAAQLRMRQHAFDDVGTDIARLQIFERAHRVVARLHRNGALDDIRAACIDSLLLHRALRHAFFLDGHLHHPFAIDIANAMNSVSTKTVQSQSHPEPGGADGRMHGQIQWQMDNPTSQRR